MSFEESLVWHASPTLASIKVANLYNFRFDSLEECLKTLECFNSLMNGKGIFIELLQNRGDFYLIYVYRKSHLLRLLGTWEVQNFLDEFRYPVEGGLLACLSFLKKKLNMGKDFPHEIGVFLGYPIADVRAFIETNGQNCTVCGEWKAYHDEEAANCTFCRYRHCRDVYVKAYGRGRKFSDMLVRA